MKNARVFKLYFPNSLPKGANYLRISFNDGPDTWCKIEEFNQFQDDEFFDMIEAGVANIFAEKVDEKNKANFLNKKHVSKWNMKNGEWSR